MLRYSSPLKPQGKTRRFILLLALLPFTGCLENPFGGDSEISTGTRSVSGTVALSDRASPQGTFVWLENYNLGAYADANGKFSLTLPPAAAQGGSGATGVFGLYFFVANYALNSATVATRNGNFIYNQAEINNKGELTSAKSLRKFLSIKTTLTPAAVRANTTDRIDVQVALQTLGDTVTVIIPKTAGVGNLMGALLLRNVARPEVYIYKTSPLGEYDDIVTLNSAPHIRAGTLSLLTLPLPPGDYEVVPYILIRHQALPKDLMATLGTNLEELGPGYLQIPMRREGELLQVLP